MKPTDLQAWRPQAPPRDFADRTTAAVLRDRASTRASARAVRWPVSLAAACLLVAAGAWAWRSHRVPPGPAVTSTPLPAAPPAVRPPAGPARPAPAPPSPPLPSLPDRVAPTPRPRVPAASATAVAAPSASTAPSARVVVPPCTCNELGCECGPEP